MSEKTSEMFSNNAALMPLIFNHRLLHPRERLLWALRVQVYV